MKTWNSEYFYGHLVSPYGRKNKRVDYATLAKAFDLVLNNHIMEATYNVGDWERISGVDEDGIEEIEEQTAQITEEIEELEERQEKIREEINKLTEDEERVKALNEQWNELDRKAKDLNWKREELEDEAYELENYEPEIYQTYIVDSRGADILQEFNKILYYNEELDMYVWGVTHFGTSWDYVLTDIKLELEDK